MTQLKALDYYFIVFRRVKGGNSSGFEVEYDVLKHLWVRKNIQILRFNGDGKN